MQFVLELEYPLLPVIQVQILQHNRTQQNTVQHSTAQHTTTQHNTTQYNKILFKHGQNLQFTNGKLSYIK